MQIHPTRLVLDSFGRDWYPAHWHPLLPLTLLKRQESLCISLLQKTKSLRINLTRSYIVSPNREAVLQLHHNVGLHKWGSAHAALAWWSPHQCCVSVRSFCCSVVLPWNKHLRKFCCAPAAPFPWQLSWHCLYALSWWCVLGTKLPSSPKLPDSTEVQCQELHCSSKCYLLSHFCYNKSGLTLGVFYFLSTVI